MSLVEVPSEGGWVVIPAMEFDSPPHPGDVVSMAKHTSLSSWQSGFESRRHRKGPVALIGRAPALQAGGSRFESE